MGDDLWQRFQRAEKEMEAELRDVVTEVRTNYFHRICFHIANTANTNADPPTKANALAPNWGQSIFQSAHEMSANAALRTQIEDHLAQADSEKKWWEKRRGQIQSDFMKELDGSEQSSSTKAVSEDDAVLVDTPSKSKKKGGKK